MEFTPDRALAVYGTLAPGEENHHAMLGIEGDWVDGFIFGYKFEVTWGGADGYPGIVLDRSGNRVPVKVMVSDNLDAHWRRLDDFEGPGFHRIVVDVYRDSPNGDTSDAGESAEPAVIGQAYVFEALTHNDD
ncbi:MAG: gamma-glutamylcyclotransferase family protein [Actinomycetota bacterium]